MDALLAQLVNRLLAHQPGVAERLLRHTGKRLRIVLPLARVDLFLDSDGRLHPDDGGRPPDCVIRLPPGLLAQLPLLGGEALARAEVEGDGLLAADLSAVLRGLDWAVLLAPLLGPVLAARADDALRGLALWQAHTRARIARALAEYLVYEARLLAEGEAVRDFVAGVDEVREAADRLEARLRLLEDRGRGS